MLLRKSLSPLQIHRTCQIVPITLLIGTGDASFRVLVAEQPTERGNEKQMRKQKGFSLIELLIVVAIILIIAAIAVPNLLRSRMAANEASAVGTIRTINTAQVMYSATYPAQGFTTLAVLGGASPCTASITTACIIDPVVSVGGTKSGFTFASAPGATVPAISFTANGNPVTFGTTGMRNFFADNSFVIRYSTNGSPASVTDTPLQ